MDAIKKKKKPKRSTKGPLDIIQAILNPTRASRTTGP